LSPYAQYLPFLAGGGGALGVWYIVSAAVGGIGSSVAAGSMGRMGGSKAMGMPSMDDIQKRMNAANHEMMPEKPLPPDMNKVQYRILASFYHGSQKPKDVATILSMDKEEVEKEIAVLLSNGYITKKNRLTSKGLELLS
jgi:hypothetical protein